MITLRPDEVAAALGVGHFPTEVRGISIDSRSVKEGDLFVALRGKRFDGHDFVAEALAAGAVGAAVERRWWEQRQISGGPPGVGGVENIYPVRDTVAALGALARAVRLRSGAIVIGVAGSVGKTGTKDLIYAMASEAGPAVKTSANQNNEIGVPLTLLSLREDTAVAVVEMGMRGAGEVGRLAAIAEPDVGVVTNVQPVHLETMGTLEAVAAAESELLYGLRPSGMGVVPADCALVEPHARVLGGRLVRFSLDENRGGCADVWGEHARSPRCGEAVMTFHWPLGEAAVCTPFASRARFHNAVAAAGACWAARLPMEICLAGLGKAVFTPGRGDLERLGEWLVIDDTYNASPAAVKASLDELMCVSSRTGGRPIAVLGDMLELGPDTLELHREVGKYAAEVGVNVFWGVGALSRESAEAFRYAAPGRLVRHVDTAEDYKSLLAALAPNDVILFKASRSLRLEMMVEAVRLLAEAGCSSRGVDAGVEEAEGVSVGGGTSA